MDHKTCFIAHTKFCAGIFLSKQIAARKPYSTNLKFIHFNNYQEALDYFLVEYKNSLTEKQIKPNTLYEVKSSNVYSVFYSGHYVGLTYSQHAFDNIRKILPNHYTELWWKHNLTYTEACEFARVRFVRYWHNPNLYIYGNLKIHNVITLSEVQCQRIFKETES